MKLSVLGFWQPTPSQPVPGPVHIMKLVSVFLSVISIGALRSAPLMTIFDVSAFANNSAGIASRRRMYKTESTRFFTARTHFCLKLDHPRLDRSIYGSAVVTRRLRSEPGLECKGDVTTVMGGALRSWAGTICRIDPGSSSIS